ncbi:MAG: hypothetical protein NTY41_09675 [Proteobacteria bacterium]|nr:hypothetical protein [Pseudomonadota bacterium]
MAMALGQPTGGVLAATDRLTEEFQRLVPLRLERPKGGKLPSTSELAKTTGKALDEFYAAARNVRERDGLGIIGRARVAFGLQQRLLLAGYPSHLIKQVLFAMLTSAFVGARR